MKRLLAMILFCCAPAFAQSVSLLPTPVQTFFGINGQPLAGGFVYVFCTGTSTPCPTYFDSSGLYLATNPIILNSMGQAQIWIPPTAIDVVVQNSFGTQQYKVTNVTSLP